jgi:citrate lyase subunit beta/citryl-CoA lyase
MVDLEDSVPQGDSALLEAGRSNVVRAFSELDWGGRLRFFRPRGSDLDPDLDDVRAIVAACGPRVEGVVYPKVDHPDEVRALDAALDASERVAGMASGSIRVELLIESVAAERCAFEIAAATSRIAGLVFGAFDYWSTLGIIDVPYRFDHPLVDEARCRIVKAAASVGVPAIAEMTTNYPTKNKSEAERASAIAELRRDAEHARELGFRGKWTGIPAQVPVVREVFAPRAERVAAAIDAVERFQDAERRGVGAVMIDGRMADRATDRMHRVTLAAARALGMIDAGVCERLGI